MDSLHKGQYADLARQTFIGRNGNRQRLQLYRCPNTQFQLYKHPTTLTSSIRCGNRQKLRLYRCPNIQFQWYEHPITLTSSIRSGNGRRLQLYRCLGTQLQLYKHPIALTSRNRSGNRQRLQLYRCLGTQFQSYKHPITQWTRLELAKSIQYGTQRNIKQQKPQLTVASEEKMQSNIECNKFTATHELAQLGLLQQCWGQV